MNISVSELIVRYLERLGIDHIFGVPGGHVLPIYDRLQVDTLCVHGDNPEVVRSIEAVRALVDGG